MMQPPGTPGGPDGAAVPGLAGPVDPSGANMAPAGGTPADYQEQMRKGNGGAPAGAGPAMPAGPGALAPPGANGALPPPGANGAPATPGAFASPGTPGAPGAPGALLPPPGAGALAPPGTNGIPPNPAAMLPPGANGAPGGIPPGQQMPAGPPMAGQFPGGAPGFGPQAGGPGGLRSPFANIIDPAAPEYPIQQFLVKVQAGDLSDAASLFSRKATGKAKTIRDGKASEEMISELQSDMADVKAQPAMSLQGKHVIVLEENAANSPAPAPTAGTYGRQRRQPNPNRAKPTRKIQFTVVEEAGQLVIQDIKVHVTTTAIRNR